MWTLQAGSSVVNNLRAIESQPRDSAGASVYAFLSLHTAADLSMGFFLPLHAQALRSVRDATHKHCITLFYIHSNAPHTVKTLYPAAVIHAPCHRLHCIQAGAKKITPVWIARLSCCLTKWPAHAQPICQFRKIKAEITQLSWFFSAQPCVLVIL